MDSPLSPLGSLVGLNTAAEQLKKNKDKSKLGATKSSSFKSALEESSISSRETDSFKLLIQSKKSSQAITDEEITNFISELNNRASELKDNPSLTSYYAFKNAIESIFKEVISQSLTLQKVITPDGKDYRFVSTTREELISLLKMLQSEHRDNLALIKQVIKINGMIVDILI